MSDHHANNEIHPDHSNGDAGRHTFELDGVRQMYEVAGDGPVCLVHAGGPGIDPDYLRFPALEQHLRMVYIHPVGTGGSGLLPGGDYAVPRYVDFAEAVLDDLGADSAFFLGHSHGGCVGLQFGLDRPGRLDGLILYSTTPVYGPELIQTATANMHAFVERWPDRPEAAEAGRMWDAVNVTHTVALDSAEAIDRYRDAIRPAYYADYRKTAEWRGAGKTSRLTFDPNRLPYEFDVRARLGEIGVPAVVLTGSHDFICPPAGAREIQEGLPHSRLLEFADSGHFAHTEEPEAFTAAVLDFVTAGVDADVLSGRD